MAQIVQDLAVVDSERKLQTGLVLLNRGGQREKARDRLGVVELLKAVVVLNIFG